VTAPAEADPSAVVADIESRSTRLLTPCGDGQLVWHRWGSGRPVVLLHGGFGSWTHWIRTIQPLAERCAVLVPDLPGLGESALPRRTGDPWELVQILADGLAAIVPPPTSYQLAGFSFGGVLCGPLASLEGERVGSVTLVGAGGVGPPWASVELESWREVADPGSLSAIHRSNLARLMFADPTAIDDLAVYLQTRNTARARLKTRPIARTGVLLETLPRVSAPVTAMYGEHDATVPSLRQREERLRSVVPDLRFRVVAGSGHWAPYERAEAVVAELARNVDEAARPRADHEGPQP
jgi:2-hydroxy-6-oxonona-2,4-dienedioate hydrolase